MVILVEQAVRRTVKQNSLIVIVKDQDAGVVQLLAIRSTYPDKVCAPSAVIAAMRFVSMVRHM